MCSVLCASALLHIQGGYVQLWSSVVCFVYHVLKLLWCIYDKIMLDPICLWNGLRIGKLSFQWQSEFVGMLYEIGPLILFKFTNCFIFFYCRWISSVKVHNLLLKPLVVTKLKIIKNNIILSSLNLVCGEPAAGFHFGYVLINWLKNHWNCPNFVILFYMWLCRCFTCEGYLTYPY